MDQLNHIAQNLVNIFSEWKVETDKYKQSIDQFQSGLNAQVASLRNFIDSNSATQSNAAKNVERTSGKRPLPQSSNRNETDAVQPKRTKTNDGETALAKPASPGKLLN